MIVKTRSVWGVRRMHCTLLLLWVLGLLWTWCGAQLLGCASSQGLHRNEKEQLALVLRLQRQNDKEKALKEVNKLIKAYPRNADAYFQRGLLFRKIGRFDKALTDYRRAIELNPRYYKAYNNIGYVYLITGRLQMALRAYGKALEILPTFIDALVSRSGLYVQLKKYDLALRDANRALAQKPNLAKAWLNKGSALYLLGREKESIHAYSKAVENAPNMREMAPAYMNRAIWNQKHGKHRAVVRDLRKVLILNPQKLLKINAHKGLAYSLYELGKMKEGVGHALRSTELSPSCPSCWLLMGLGLENLKDPSFAIEAFTKVIQLVPGHPKALYRRGLVYFRSILTQKTEKEQLNRLNKAYADFQKCRNLNPKHAECYVGLAIIAGYQNKTEEAARLIKKAESLGVKLKEGFIKFILKGAGE